MYIGRENIYLVQTQQWTLKRGYFGPVYYYTVRNHTFAQITAQFGYHFNNKTDGEPIETRIIAMRLLLTHKRRPLRPRPPPAPKDHQLHTLKGVMLPQKAQREGVTCVECEQSFLDHDNSYIIVYTCHDCGKQFCQKCVTDSVDNNPAPNNQVRFRPNSKYQPIGKPAGVRLPT